MTRQRPRKPWLVCIVALGCIGFLPALFWWEGTSEETLRWAARATARTSFVFFAAAFFATSLKQLFPHPASTWLVDHRRELGLSFACIHGSHAVVIACLAAQGASLGVAPFSVGWLALVLVGVMAATSNDASRRGLGAGWTRLHTLGGYLIAYVFGLSFLPAARESAVAFVELSALCAGLGCRFAAFRASRNPKPRELGVPG